MSKETKNATVKEIAHLAGVSIGTVDRVLHGRGGVSEGTRKRVEAIVKSVGFRPNVLARQLSLGTTYAFRVLIPRAEQDSGYWGLCLDGIRAAARDLAAFAVRVEVVEFDRYDKPKYRDILSRVLAEPGDGLLVAPVLPDELGAALARLPPGFPYAFFDGDLEGSSPVFSIGQDAAAAGVLAGRLLSLLAPGGGTLAAIDAHPEDRHLRRRIEGFVSFFGAGSGPARPARRIVVRECPGFERAEACGGWLARLFAEEPGVEGILVASASGHLAAEWLAAQGRKRDVALLSWDLVPHNARALMEGGIDCVISQRPREQGRRGLERLYRTVVHGDSGGAATVGSEIYLRENLPPGAEEGEGEP